MTTPVTATGPTIESSTTISARPSSLLYFFNPIVTSLRGVNPAETIAEALKTYLTTGQLPPLPA